jgi:cyclase
MYIHFANGADKISVNTSAFQSDLIVPVCKFGHNVWCWPLTPKGEDGEWYVYLNGGREKTEILTGHCRSG